MGILKVVISAALLLGITTAATGAERHQTYRWVDNNGVIHYGDRIPPEYAENESEILNDQGVTIGLIEGRKSPEQIAEEARLAAIEDEKRRVQQMALRRDRVLLETYLSVEEIELLRDRRLELMDSQIRVTEQYLKNLRARLEGLQTEASFFQPYSENPDAAMIDNGLLRELTHTKFSIDLYEDTVVNGRQVQDDLRVQFAGDIDRFRELRGARQ